MQGWIEHFTGIEPIYTVSKTDVLTIILKVPLVHSIFIFFASQKIEFFILCFSNEKHKIKKIKEGYLIKLLSNN